jgi:[CysO sulfur-carrier protein]-S-L-cysteine hydrolase
MLRLKWRKLHKMFRLGKIDCLLERPMLSRSERLLLPRRNYLAMVQHAQTELPNECCGLLAGERDGDELRALVWHPLVNEAASPIEYHSEPRSMFLVTKEMRKSNHDVLAIYHSHPASEPIPSRTDLERNYSPDVVNLIVSLNSPDPLVRAWWLTESEFMEAAWTIVDP